MSPSLHALDLSNLGTRIGDRTKPLAPATMARAERCRQRFAEFPAVFMPGNVETELAGQVFAAHRLGTVAGTQKKAVMLAAVDNYQGAPRGVGEPLPTQVGSETMGLLTAGITANRENATSRSLGEPMATVVGNAGSGGIGVLSTGILPFRRNTVPTVHAEPMPTVTSEQTPGMLTAVGVIKNNGSIEEARYRAHPVSGPLGTVVASGAQQALLFSGWHEQHVAESHNQDWWLDALAELSLEDCYFRMLGPHEVGRGCGFDVDFPGYSGSFVVWGSARDQVDGFGNAVSPQVGEWIGRRLRAALHGGEVAQ